MELDGSGMDRMRRILRHRLLNIVSGVKSANTMLANHLDDRLTPRERDYFPLIQKECDQISLIVTRIDDLFGTPPPCAPASFKSAITTIMTDLRGNYPTAEINLDVQMEDTERKTCSTALRTVLLEAVGNAVEISLKPVTICLSDKDNACLIRVIDQGDPLSDEVCEMAFEAFYTGRSRHLGVGLSLARQTVEHFGGTVSIGTEECGNVVEFVLPYVQEYDRGE